MEKAWAVAAVLLCAAAALLPLGLVPAGAQASAPAAQQFPAAPRAIPAAPQPAADGTGWPVFLGDEVHSGFAPGPAPDTASAAWIFQTGGAVASSASVSGGRAFFTSQDGSAYCLNETTGALIWKRDVGATASTPAAVGGSVFLGGGDGAAHCLAAANGTPVWSVPGIKAHISSPVPADAGIVFSTYDNRVACLNYTTGATIWNFTVAPILQYTFISSSPAFWGGKVYIGSKNGQVCCLDSEGLSDGSNDGVPDAGLNNSDLLWNFSAPMGVLSSPVIHNGSALIFCDDNCLYSLNATTGALQWKASLVGGLPPAGQHPARGPAAAHPPFPSPSCVRCNMAQSPAVAYGRAYIVSDSKVLFCIRPENGSVIWSVPLPAHALSTPAIADGKIFLGLWETGQVTALSADDGSQLWAYETGREITSSASICHGRVLIGGTSGDLYSLGDAAYSVSATLQLGSPSVYATEAVGISVLVTNGSAPVPNATVRLSGSGEISFNRSSGRTDSLGYFNTTATAGLLGAPANCTVTARADAIGYGYGTDSKTVAVRPILRASAIANPASVQSGGSSALRFYAYNGIVWVQGAGVALSAPGNGTLDRTSGLTDASGIFACTFTAPAVSAPTNFTVTASLQKAFFRPCTASLSIQVFPSGTKLLSVNASAFPVQVYSGDASALTVYVSDQAAGTVVANASVSAVASAGSCSPAGGTASADGTWSTVFTAPQADSMAVAEIAVNASLPGYLGGSAIVQVTVLPFPQIELKVSRQPGGSLLPGQGAQVTVEVSSGGSPLAGAAVDFNASAGSFNASAEKSGANGVAVATYTAPVAATPVTATITVSAQMARHRPANASFAIDIVPQEKKYLQVANFTAAKSSLLLNETTVVTLMVLCNGTPVMGAGVNISASRGVLRATSGFTNATGHFSCLVSLSGLSPNETAALTATASRPGYENGSSSLSLRIIAPAPTVPKPSAQGADDLAATAITAAVLCGGLLGFVLIAYADARRRGRGARAAGPAALCAVAIVGIILLPVFYQGVTTQAQEVEGEYLPHFAYTDGSGGQNTTAASNGTITVIHFMNARHDWSAITFDDKNAAQLDALGEVRRAFPEPGKNSAGGGGPAVFILTVVRPSCCMAQSSSVLSSEYDVSKITWPVHVDVGQETFFALSPYISDSLGNLRSDPLVLVLDKSHRIYSETGAQTAPEIKRKVLEISNGTSAAKAGPAATSRTELFSLYLTMFGLGLVSFIAPCCLAFILPAIPVIARMSRGMGEYGDKARPRTGKGRLGRGPRVRREGKATKEHPVGRWLGVGLAFSLGMGLVFLAIGGLTAYFSEIAQLQARLALFSFVAGIMHYVLGAYTYWDFKRHEKENAECTECAAKGQALAGAAGGSGAEHAHECGCRDAHEHRHGHGSGEKIEKGWLAGFGGFSRHHPFIAPLAFGLVFGVIAIPCAITFILPALVIIVIANPPVIVGCALLFVFGIARGLLVAPLLAAVDSAESGLQKRYESAGSTLTVVFTAILFIVGTYLCLKAFYPI